MGKRGRALRSVSPTARSPPEDPKGSREVDGERAQNTKRHAAFDMGAVLAALEAVTMSEQTDKTTAIATLREMLSLTINRQGLREAQSSLFGESLFKAIDNGCSDHDLLTVSVSAYMAMISIV